MRKRNLISALGVAGVTTGVILGNKRIRQKVKEGLIGSEKPSENSTLYNAGIPDQISSENEAQLENAKMVSEGSQFGVHYYNDSVTSKDTTYQ